MPITTMTHRSHLVRSLPAGSVVIELGVAAGMFAEEMLRENPGISYTGIDRWSDHHDEAEMWNARARLAAVSNDVRLIRMTFAEALPYVAPLSADLCYVDGYAHTGQEGGSTLEDWWPKVKPGGIFAGHDYCEKYQPTIDAVNAFTQRHGLALNLIEDGDHPSWWVSKPE